MNEIIVQQYKPSEIIAIFNDILSRQNTQTGGKLVCIRGIYIAKQQGQGWQYVFDSIHDEASQDELTIRMTQQQRQELTNGNLVEVYGTLGRNINNRGNIQLVLNVSRIAVVQEQVVDEDEQRRWAARQMKTEAGFKSIKSDLEAMLFNEQRPKVMRATFRNKNTGIAHGIS